MISVIVPSYNQAPYLSRCLDSILEQEHRPIEILVMDGASTDGTVDVLHEYDDVPEVRWWSEPDSGPAEAVNKGLAKATGRIAAIQSSDDFYLPGAFHHVTREFDAHPEVGFVYGDVRSVDVHENVKRVWRRPQHSNALCIALCICIPQSSAFFDLELARSLGGWRDRYHTADWDLWLRMMFLTEMRKVDAELSAWRVYPGQRTDARRAVFEDFRRMIDESDEISAAGWRVRQAARASRQMIGISFDRGSGWRRARYLLSATLMYPGVWRHVPGKREILLPQRLRRGQPGGRRASNSLRDT